jgi:hypothetical protein
MLARRSAHTNGVWIEVWSCSVTSTCIDIRTGIIIPSVGTLWTSSGRAKSSGRVNCLATLLDAPAVLARQKGWVSYYILFVPKVEYAPPVPNSQNTLPTNPPIHKAHHPHRNTHDHPDSEATDTAGNLKTHILRNMATSLS